MKIKTKDFIKKVAQKSGVTQVTVRKVYDAIGEVAFEELLNENTVTMFKGMSIYGERVPAKVWKSPSTGEREELPSRVTPRARFAYNFRAQLRDETAD